MIKHVFIGLICGLTLILQTSLFSNNPLFRDGINVYILVLIFLMLVLRFKQFLVWTLVFGLGLDVYSGLGYGVITLALFAAAIAAYLLYMNYFSHQTNFSLILLTATMLVVYNIFLSLVSVIFFTFGFSWVYIPMNTDWFIRLGYQLLGTGLTFILLYVFFHSTIERFREQFIIRRT